MTNATVKGVVELQAQVLAECPDYTTVGLRTGEGDLIELFLSSQDVAEHPERYQLGQSLRLAGGEWQTDPATAETEVHRRYWPAVVEYAQ